MSKYTTIESILPGQTRYWAEGVEKKILDFTVKNWAKEITKNQFELAFNNNTSTLPLEKAIPVIVVTDNSGFIKYIALDGHHDLIANKRLGGKTMPIIEKLDLSHYKFEEAIKYMVTNNLVYYKSLGGENVSWVDSFDKLIEDPLRGFISLHERKVYADGSSSGAEYILWIKSMDKERPVKHEINFSEFIMADALIREGFTLDNSKSTKELVDQARDILVTLNIFGINIAKVPGYFSDAKYKEYIFNLDHQQRTQSDLFLSTQILGGIENRSDEVYYS
ncbi:hypothetical protein [Candidatus Tisiphia endosymbiont of Temnostethus pusillus]|uniref:hypothetical protein n=1 Tax=Candidatus Tisiphia endosymbiont of Temnostethus pusillus TaxID=3139335 RepID=UPI0035C892BC